MTNNEVVDKLLDAETKKSKKIRQEFLEIVQSKSNQQYTLAITAQPNWTTPPTDTPDLLYDLEFMQVQKLWIKYGIRGQGAKVYVIDSGIDDHVSFNHLKDLKSKSFLKDDNSPKDTFGHGTWVCGKIAAQGVGIAPRCEIISLRCLDENGSGSTEVTNNALQYILADKEANIVNMSLACVTKDSKQEQLIKRLTDLGVIVVASAGNYGTDLPCYPGSFLETLCVTATDKKDNKADFSNMGGQIDIAAPGVACYSTYLDNKFRAMSGTSMAAPIVTGLLTLGISYLKMLKINDRKEISKIVLQALQQTASDLGPAGKDKIYGFGIINSLAFFERLALA